MTRRAGAVAGWLAVALAATSYLGLDAARMTGAVQAAPLGKTAQTAQPITAPAPPNAAPAADRAVLDKYCVTCHNQRLKTAGLMLDTLDLGRAGDHADAWEKVAQKLRTREMPPPRAPRPDDATYAALAGSVEAALDRAAANHPNPGRVPVHRLNRAEYANAIRDLLALEIDGRALLPADDADQQGFDNIAGVLSVSPALLERYMSAARKISRLAIGDPTILPGFETYKNPKMLTQDERMDEDLPFGSRGGIAVSHVFPLDGDYVVRVSLKRQLYGYILGVGEAHQLEVRLDGKRVQRFTIGGQAPGKPAPATFVGNMLGDPDWEVYMQGADAGLEVKFPVSAGMHRVGVSFVDEPTEAEGVLQPPQTGFDRATNEMYDGNPAIESIAVGGPYQASGPGQSLTRQKVFVCRPVGPDDEAACAQKIVKTLARRAYRKAVTDEDVQPLLEFYESGRSAGGFDLGIQRVLERLLTDPNFIFRIERDPAGVAPGTPYRLTDVELASRLAFFLWSSVPDDELLNVAIAGKLKDPAVLETQVRRLLGDARSKALVSNFAGQWLGLRKLPGITPDPDRFPEFDDNLRLALMQETELFVDSQLRADRSVTELLTADYTFVNERLARHYGIPNVYGSRFRRVPASDERRGLLGQGSILALTSYPNRTSPVLRGKWVLDNILGSPPPPPPPNVPDLKETGDDGRRVSVRERMEQHRKNPVCASCHVRMDPIGFALENFDAVGKWRTTSDGAAIDTSGVFPDGSQFKGGVELRAIMVGHRDQLVGTITRKLLTYALGRGVESYDLPAVRAITREAAASDDRWSAIILGIVRSTPFQMRRSAS
jgi:mono/diheme cytochrome c family protein